MKQLFIVTIVKFSDQRKPFQFPANKDYHIYE